MITPQPAQDFFNSEHGLVCTLAEQIIPNYGRLSSHPWTDCIHNLFLASVHAGEANFPHPAELTTSCKTFTTIKTC